MGRSPSGRSRLGAATRQLEQGAPDEGLRERHLVAVVRQGIGATPPRTMRAAEHDAPSMSTAAATLTRAKSIDSFSLNLRYRLRQPAEDEADAGSVISVTISPGWSTVSWSRRTDGRT